LATAQHSNADETGAEQSQAGRLWSTDDWWGGQADRLFQREVVGATIRIDAAVGEVHCAGVLCGANTGEEAVGASVASGVGVGARGTNAGKRINAVTIEAEDIDSGVADIEAGDRVARIIDNADQCVVSSVVSQCGASGDGGRNRSVGVERDHEIAVWRGCPRVRERGSRADRLIGGLGRRSAHREAGQCGACEQKCC